MRRRVTATVRKVKNNWFQRKAKEIESKVMKGIVGDAWKCIRDMICKEKELASGQKLLGNLIVTFALFQWRVCKGGNNSVTF